MNEQYREAMGKALFLANRARETGDVPVGAVVVDENGRIIGRGWNCREANHDPAGHAEIVALREAGRARGTWRLTGCTLIVTLEPCTMCAGAILASRIDRVVFGAWDPKAGAAGSLRDVLRDARMPHPTEVIGGVLAQEAAMQLRSFFLSCRTPNEMPVVQAPVHEPNDLVAPIVVPYEEDEAPEQVHEKATHDEGVPAQLPRGAGRSCRSRSFRRKPSLWNLPRASPARSGQSPWHRGLAPASSSRTPLLRACVRQRRHPRRLLAPTRCPHCPRLAAALP